MADNGRFMLGTGGAGRAADAMTGRRKRIDDAEDAAINGTPPAPPPPASAPKPHPKKQSKFIAFLRSKSDD